MVSELPCFLWLYHFPRAFQPRISITLAWLTKSLATGNWSHLQPPPYLRARSGGGTESSNSLIMAGPSGSQPPILRGVPKGASFHKLRCVWKGLIMNNKSLLVLLWLWNYFRNWLQKTKYHNKKITSCLSYRKLQVLYELYVSNSGCSEYIFLIINHSFTTNSAKSS